MPDYNTPGVPTPEDSAKAQRAKTAALPYEENCNPPAVYDQSVPCSGGKLPKQVGQNI